MCLYKAVGINVWTVWVVVIDKYRKTVTKGKGTIMAGILHTMGWTILHESFSYDKPGKQVLEELLIPLNKIYYVQRHNDGKGDTC